jgi:phosphatidylserine/phosphatidylglycerophosphate/cardiolipin synthase-like enzyme
MATCFSIPQDCASLIASLIGRANRSVHVAVFIFTNPSLADALVAAQRRGVNVIVVIERNNANATGSQVGYLRANNVTVVLDENPYLMHHKFAVIDEEIVIVGSYNWTLAAENRNDESILIIRDREIAGRFEEEFRRLLLEAGYE